MNSANLTDLQNSLVPNEQDRHDARIDTKFNNFAKQFKVARFLKESGIKKVNGYLAYTIFMFLLILPFIGKNIYRFFVLHDKRPVQKDAVYTFLKTPNFNWEKFNLKVSSEAVSYINTLNDTGHKSVFIVDDTTFDKSRSSYVELLAKVYDHVNDVFFKGFRYLTLGWSDGATFIPVQGRLLSSKEDKNVYNKVQKHLDPRSLGARRRVEAQTPAPQVMQRMLKSALDAGLRAAAIVFDTWFATYSNIIDCAKLLPVICMTKVGNNFMYRYKGKKLTAEGIKRELNKSNSRKVSKNKNILASVKAALEKYVEVNGKKEKVSVDGKLVFIKNRNEANGWLTLFSTDLSLSDEEIVKLYAIRWDIETYHKDIKSFLDFERGCQSIDYDSLTAYTTVVMIRYIFLNIQKRIDIDKRTFGLLFHSVYDELVGLSFEESIILIINNFMTKVKHALENNEDVEDAMNEYKENVIKNGIKTVFDTFIFHQFKPASTRAA